MVAVQRAVVETHNRQRALSAPVQAGDNPKTYTTKGVSLWIRTVEDASISSTRIVRWATAQTSSHWYRYAVERLPTTGRYTGRAYERNQNIRHLHGGRPIDQTRSNLGFLVRCAKFITPTRGSSHPTVLDILSLDLSQSKVRCSCDLHVPQFVQIYMIPIHIHGQRRASMMEYVQ